MTPQQFAYAVSANTAVYLMLLARCGVKRPLLHSVAMALLGPK